MLDRLTSMAVFVRAADLGSFTAAGVSLGITSQMVGKHVAALEQRLGVVLLERTTRRMRLTETGQRYHERCRAALAEAAAADAVVEQVDDEPRGQLRISAPVGFGACRLAPIVTDFVARHHGVEVELTLTDRYVDLVHEGYDAVLRLGPIEEPSLAVRELIEHRQVACASPDYLARHGTPEAPSDLAAHVCLSYVNWSGRHYSEWKFRREGTIQAVRIRSRLAMNDGRALVAAALAGHGVILQPEAVVADALAQGSLVAVLADYRAPTRSLCLMHTAREPLPNKLRTFIKYVVEALERTSSDAIVGSTARRIEPPADHASPVRSFSGVDGLNEQ